MDRLTAKILSWDLEHLTSRQKNFLHKLRKRATQEQNGRVRAKQKHKGAKPCIK